MGEAGDEPEGKETPVGVAAVGAAGSAALVNGVAKSDNDQAPAILTFSSASCSTSTRSAWLTTERAGGAIWRCPTAAEAMLIWRSEGRGEAMYALWVETSGVGKLGAMLFNGSLARSVAVAFIVWRKVNGDWVLMSDSREKFKRRSGWMTVALLNSILLRSRKKSDITPLMHHSPSRDKIGDAAHSC
jgi:hypothetical protein